MTREDLIGPVEGYYTDYIRTHGASAAGVDWDSPESQKLRFDLLLQVLDRTAYSITDYGCGYGALVHQLRARRHDYRYVGYDISSSMLAEARREVGDDPRCTFHSHEDALARTDFVVASGIFNVKLRADPRAWHRHVVQTLDRLADLSQVAFAFNVLTAHSDPGHRRDDLYYAEPGPLLEHCARSYSRHVALRQDYGLYEFTVFVRHGGPDARLGRRSRP